MRRIFSYLYLFVVISLLICPVQGIASHTINYQGFITGSSGTPLNGQFNLTFSIYNIEIGGSALWTSARSIDIENGVYSIELGELVPLSLAFDEPYWLGITVETDDEMEPRQRLTSIGNAIRADVSAHALSSDTLDGLDSADFSLSNHAHDMSELTGTLSDSQLSGSYSGPLSFTDITSATISSININGTADLSSAMLRGGVFTNGNFSGTGAGLTDLSAANITHGTLDPARLSGTYPISISGNSSTSSVSLDSKMLEGKTLAELDARYVVASQIPRTNLITTVDSDGSVGQYTSITIGTDGLPVVSYFAISGSDLKVLKCGNISCNSDNIVTTIDQDSVVGQYSSITIGTDGLPVISYYDATNGDLKIAKCGDPVCSKNNTITGIPSVDTEGSYSSISIGTDGLPVVSYYEETSRDLKFLKCGNPACSANNLITTIDSIGFVGKHSSISIGADGYPVIAYYDESNRDLKVAKCMNAACSFGTKLITIDSEGFVGKYSSITIGPDGLPIISYFDESNRDLKTAKCADFYCSVNTALVIVDSPGFLGEHTSITIGFHGLPVISYYDSSNQHLKAVKCGNASCSSGNTIITLDDSGSCGQFGSLTMGMDGLPVFSYFDAKNENLKIAKCANTFCLNNWTRR
ncbi:MAG: pentapeptide repeat-containing protein [Nitrospirota bacterium]|nr:MAG: pentapeptide repeat-containing protein [Nitrospirota bacterium]